MLQKVFITGASSGFGKLIAETLLKNGHLVVASMRDLSGRNKTVADALTKAGAFIVELDVTNEASVKNGVDAALRQAGGLDVVVNNAGVGVLGWQESFTSEDWQRIFDINVFGVQRVNRAILPHFREKGGGLLLHISSLLGRMVIPFYGPYNASKFALEALADNYRVELGRFGIESIIVEPGGYGTDFAVKLIRPSDADRTKSLKDLASAPDHAFAAFSKVFEGPNAPNPQWVADAVTGLIEMPRGTRPFRTTVDRLGMGDAVTPYNALAEEVIRKVYTAFGMGDALKLKN